ncbi:hypothetical protein LPJ78_004642 [Coemansia sp. RSA 989]|nr:hypothetical protein LPJ68_000435 [Coemansia sp. RSA 1086]KAJ1753523.1 hypothetical protein LPJ79_000383 [Coemansia sp. RSA 1821]KAJ1862568.1 hypothetical protein LPJ78_004642 [Coemansia sp. RSA 989]KAJ1870452.1 hypothetical protein LPJ55_004664 [Coemansia sp. RSA 990]KAJ2632007.1 hypothetical protein H4R22_001580 [Coemansia sp. RSA 1290]KAJ2651699.1 hypothetical protein IWW40_001600 [Coemansia sp. RSA 1250]KAJ2676673.1 hypothetical protein IWW42_000549 [Coemansia sp. RSA 1085]
MAAAGLGHALKPRIDPETRETVLSSTFNVNATNPGSDDVVTIVVCSGLFGLTAIMLTYAWCNYNYRPIRAKNLTWTTLIYFSTVLWFVGDLVTNNHVRLVGVWSECKLWILWFRVFFVYVFASMTIVRFYALDRVFNQKKPFTKRSSFIAGLIVISFNVTYALINQLISDRLTLEYDSTLELCNITMPFRISALTIQWIMWAGCSVLMFRLRNIQSSFNEFRESILIFLVIIALLTETTVTNLHFKYYIFVKWRRIEKTCVDVVAATLVIWIFIGYPVYMSIFHRKQYEQKWLEKLAQDAPGNTYNVTSNPKGTTAYEKMDDIDSGFNNSQFNYHGTGMMDMSYSHRPFGDADPLNIESGLSTHAPFNDNLLPAALRSNINRPEMNTPTTFNSYLDQPHEGRHVL